MKPVMKRFVSIAILCMLTIVMFFSFSGCGAAKEKQIDSALQGTWYFSTYGPVFEMTFKKGTVIVHYNWHYGIDGFGGNYYGTYSVNAKGEVINCVLSEKATFTNKTGREEIEKLIETVEFSYNSKTGELTLWYKDEQGSKD